MKTPICDFIERYNEKSPARLHMPGHKGISLLGCEYADITEITGADALYSADGIIRQSEENASRLFGCESFYSAEGSSLCIRAMLYLLKTYGITRVISARNAHSSFLSACALVDITPIWLYGRENAYLSCDIDPNTLEALVKESDEPTALYITSPDYLGNLADIKGFSALCKRYNVLLCVDCAHGSYLKFLNPSQYPTDLGADICCSSAHKTLPVLTGGAYLHISHSADSFFAENAKRALMLFGSTSPSYIILQSLDKVNLLLESDFPKALAEFLPIAEQARQRLAENGYTLCGGEPLKLTVSAKKYGYLGEELARILESYGIYIEFSDADYLVLMLSPLDAPSLTRALDVLCAIEKKSEICIPAPAPARAEIALSPREAIMARSEKTNIHDSVGRILSQPSISCPPAVPIAVCGEIITDTAVKCFEYYRITEIYTVKE